MEFKHIQGLTPDGTVYYNEDMGTLEAMVPPGKYSTAHAPALLELENGDMLCAWFAGSFEGSKDISIVCARWENGSDHWSEPVQVSYDSERSEQNPSLFKTGRCRMVYVYSTVRPYGRQRQHAVHLHYPLPEEF